MDRIESRFMSKEYLSIYLSIMLWVALIVYLVLGYSKAINWITIVFLFLSVVIDYINVTCRGKGVSFNRLIFRSAITSVVTISASSSWSF